MLSLAVCFFSLRHFGAICPVTALKPPVPYSLAYLLGHNDRIDLIFFGHFKKIRSMTKNKQLVAILCVDARLPAKPLRLETYLMFFQRTCRSLFRVFKTVQQPFCFMAKRARACDDGHAIGSFCNTAQCGYYRGLAKDKEDREVYPLRSLLALLVVK